MIVMLHPVLLIISRMLEDSHLQLQLVHHRVCAGSKSWWTVECEGVIWEGEEPSTTGVKCGCWFDGTWIIFDGTNVFLFRMPSLGPW